MRTAQLEVYQEYQSSSKHGHQLTFGYTLTHLISNLETLCGNLFSKQTVFGNRHNKSGKIHFVMRRQAGGMKVYKRLCPILREFYCVFLLETLNQWNL